MNSDIVNEFSSNDTIYLNNASVSIVPSLSIKAMNEFLHTYNAIGPDSLESERYVIQKLRDARKIVSELINCRPEEIVLTQSTTDGINIVANGLKLDPNSNIVIRDRTHEHHANYYPWLRLATKIDLKSLKIDKNGFFSIAELRKKIDNNTKLVVLSHALYNSGAILPVEEVGDLLNAEGIPFFIDAAQTVGCLERVDVKSIKCNFMSFNGSKWLCGPMGIGLFYCNKASSELLKPMSIGGESAMIYDTDKIAFKDIPDKFQTGFRNYVGAVGLEASARCILKFGLANIRKKVIKLANILREELSKDPRVTIYGPHESELRTSIVSFNIKGIEPKNVVEKLEKQKIILAQREILEKKIVRASPHFFNTEEEILATAKALKSL